MKYYYVTFTIDLGQGGQLGSCIHEISGSDPGNDDEFYIGKVSKEIGKTARQSDPDAKDPVILSWREITKAQFEEYRS